VGVGPTMADLQSAALATWLRRLLVGYWYRTQTAGFLTKAAKSGKCDGDHSKTLPVREGEQSAYLPFEGLLAFCLRFAVCRFDLT
jgi:hypothetical protein